MKRPTVWRSVVAAGAAWPTAWFCLDPETKYAQVMILGCCLVAVVLMLGPRRMRTRIWAGGLAMALTSAIVATSALIHVGNWQRSPWPQLIEDRQTFVLEVELTGHPQIRSRPGFSGIGRQQTFATGRVHSVTIGDQRWALRSEVWLTAPAHDPPLQRGDFLRAQGRALGADLRQGVAADVTLTDLRNVQSRVSARTTVDSWFDVALANGSQDAAALVRGMAIGDDTDLAPETRDRVQRVGLSHLTAVSGANLAIIVATVLSLGVFVGASQRVMLVPAGLAMLGYAALVGGEPSVLRATAMAVVMLAAMVFGGGAGLAALGTAVTVLLVWQPALASSRGFALSVAATAGLVLAAPMARRVLSQVGRVLSQPWRPIAQVTVTAVLTALAAAVATAPLLAAYGNGVSWISVIANASVAALVPLITVGGLLSAICVPVHHALAAVVSEVPLLGARWILTVAAVADSMHFGRVEVAPGWFGFTLVITLFVLAWSVPPKWRRALAPYAAVAAVGVVLVAQLPMGRGGPPRDWLVIFCDVGQGDAALVRTGERSALLIDTGPDPRALHECLGRSDVTIEAVVLTHFHLDHTAGLPVILEQGVPHVWVSPLAEPVDVASEVRTRLRELDHHEIVGRAGIEHRYGWAVLQFLGPEEVITDGSAANNSSLITRVVVDPRHEQHFPHGTDSGELAPGTSAVGEPSSALSMLFTGDIEPEAQSRLMRRAGDPLVDVVKVPHHGSANQHPRFAEWVRAAVAVFSCGEDNPYGHPADITVRAWQSSGALVRRTDTDGDVYVWKTADGQITTAVRPTRGRLGT